MAVQIVTDSTSCIERAYAAAHRVELIPLTFSYQGREWEDGFAGESQDIFQDKEQSFHTSQPPVERFQRVFQAALDQGREVVAVLISAGLSGTANSARLAAGMTTAPSRIHIVDSQNTAIVLKFLVERAVELAEAGRPAGEIEGELLGLADRSNVLIAVRSLDYLHNGGRLTRVQAMLGSLLHICPIVTCVEGRAAMVGKVRLFRRSLEEVVRRIPATVCRIGVGHIQCEAETETMIELIARRFPQLPISREQVSPVVSAHLGPCIGVGYHWA